MSEFEYTLRDIIEHAANVTTWFEGNDFERKYEKSFDDFAKTHS